jgi:tRNA pseudouridine55 synthase
VKSGAPGLLLVDKPAGPTSHDVVQAARRALRQRRIGHTGTLDPAATGLLVLCVGRATRLQQFLLAWPKTYEGEIRLGFATTTYDADGAPVEPTRPVPPLEPARLAELAPRFTGELEQLPPPYSAKKIAGRKFYELAREGQEVPRESKHVRVFEFRLEPVDADHLRFSVSCSSGTYVRSLAHDIGEALGCGGHLASLRRVAVGPWLVADGVSAEALANRPQELPPGAFIPLTAAVLPFPQVALNPTAADHFAHGQEVVVREAEGEFTPGGQVAVSDRAGELLGVGQAVIFRPRARTLHLAPRLVLTEVESAAKP